MNKFSCPFCDYQMDDATSMSSDSKARPRNGDCSVCASCGEPSIFVKAFSRISLRKPTVEEYGQMMADPNIFKAIAVAKFFAGVMPPERERETE